MEKRRTIKSALVSVYYKDHLEPIIKSLSELGVKMYSTGGTEKFIRECGAEVTAVEELTSYPSILGGRVKTLHPGVFGGILSRRDNPNDLEQLAQFNIPEIDLVIVDLYPFEETMAAGGSHEALIEKIDIGGISLIRAAAKNHNDVLIVSSKNQYTQLEQLLKEEKGVSSLDQRRDFAAQAFQITSHYDSLIFNYFNTLATPQDTLNVNIAESQVLRYGENPHQKGVFYGRMEDLFTKLNGKDLSYNNLVDIDAAVRLIAEFTEPTFAVLKHTNVCGIASCGTLVEAWTAALAADPISAFGGVLVCNREMDAETALLVHSLFFEVLIAPSYSEEALQILKAKKNRILLIQHEVILPVKQYKSILNGIVEQDMDLVIEGPELMRTVTTVQPTLDQLTDLAFALKLVKHTKSNAIILAKNKQLLASGVGQTSRIDALKQAIHKAAVFGFDIIGSVMASDAFFPFPDCVEVAAGVGIAAVVEPGGSVKDQDSIDAADRLGIAMVLTGVRHFKH